VIAPEMLVARVRALPALPAAAHRLGALLHDERSTASDFERAIRPDPALTANLLRLVNSAYFGLRSRAETVRQAVTLLGLKRTFELASSASLAPLLPARLPGYEVDAKEFWLHCIAVAVLSERLSIERGDAKMPDLLFTAGLLHDVGKLAIVTFVSQESERILERVRGDDRPFVCAERDILGVDHCDAGAAVAEAWSLPRAVAWAASWHHAPSVAPPEVDRGVVDLVHAADALAHALGLGADVGELAREIDPGVQERLGLKVSRLERVASRSLEEIHEMASLFKVGAGARA